MNRKIFLLVMLTFLAACEEVIEVELDDADPQVVIEAKISDNSEKNMVSLTLSTDFYEPSNYETLSNVEIVVTEVGGESFAFTEISPGKYSNENLIAREGSEYSISVNYDNITYSANSSLRKKLTIDSLQITEEERRFSDDIRYEIHCYFQDNPGYEDYARLKVYINGIERDGLTTYDDRLSDGNSIEFNRFQIEQEDDEDKLHPGDEITIELLTIDESAYEYLSTLSGVLASSGGEGGMMSGSTPANPTTNWDNDALGYFSAYSIDSKSIVIE